MYPDELTKTHWAYQAHHTLPQHTHKTDQNYNAPSSQFQPHLKSHMHYSRQVTQFVANHNYLSNHMNDININININLNISTSNNMYMNINNTCNNTIININKTVERIYMYRFNSNIVISEPVSNLPFLYGTQKKHYWTL